MELPRGNSIIDALIASEPASLLASAQVVELEHAQVTTFHSTRMLNVDFPVTAALSSMAILQDGSTLEVASIGFEGFVEVDAALRHEIAHRTSICQFAGTAIRLSIADFKANLATNARFADAVYGAIRVRIFITEQMIVCSRRHSVDQRLARWLLTIADKTKHETIPVTHEVLGTVLGARRAGITEAALDLARSGLVNRTGIFEIADRPALELRACECYEVCRTVSFAGGTESFTKS